DPDALPHPVRAAGGEELFDGRLPAAVGEACPGRLHLEGEGQVGASERRDLLGAVAGRRAGRLGTGKGRRGGRREGGGEGRRARGAQQAAPAHSVHGCPLHQCPRARSTPTDLRGQTRSTALVRGGQPDPDTGWATGGLEGAWVRGERACGEGNAVWEDDDHAPLAYRGRAPRVRPGRDSR